MTTKSPQPTRDMIAAFVALLPVGDAGRISADALCVALGIAPAGRASTDNERRVVRALREAAVRELGVLAVADEGGYFVPVNGEQVDAAHGRRRSQALTMLDNLRAERALAEAMFERARRGQLALDFAGERTVKGA